MKLLNIPKVGNVNYSLPYDDGTANQVLKTDGSGNVSWAAEAADLNYFASSGIFNTANGELTITVSGSSDVVIDLDGRYLTTHPSISAGSSQDNSGNTFLQDITIDTNGHVTAVGNNTVTLGTFTLRDGADSDVSINDRTFLKFEGFTHSGGTGITSDPYIIQPPAYTAGSGLDLTTGAFSVEPDLRDGITHIGVSTNNYIQFDNTNNRIDFYAGGVFVARLESDGDLHVKGDVIAFSNIF